MKLDNIFKGLAVATILVAGMTACTEQIKFGDSFIEKTPGGDVTADTVFHSAEYTEQFLTGIYAQQYYGLPYRSTHNSSSYFSGQIETMSDCWHMPTSSISVTKQVYGGQMTAASGQEIYGYDKESIWEMVHRCYMLIERINEVPDMDETTKKRFIAEAKCIIASSYFNLLRYYGGLPLVKHSYGVNDDKTDIQRASVENTVNFIVGLFDEAINSGAMPWSYTTDASTMTAHWTKAAAMAMKCRVLQFAASPLFNDAQPYYSGVYSMENAAQDSLLWYGGKKPELWQQCKKACEDFFKENANNGEAYHMVEPTTQTQEAYRYAFRHAYMDQSSPEVIFSTRVTDNNSNSKYNWICRSYLRGNDRYAYNPTQEFVEMFPWADGKPFNWEETEKAGELDHMFINGTFDKNKQELQNIKYTRDPRLYETVTVNGQRNIINYSNGNTTGLNVELWVGGTLAGSQPISGSGAYGNGYFINKHIADGPFLKSIYTGEVYKRKAPHWPEIRVADLYLIYAEALLQADGNNAKAIEYVDKIRSRVGLKGLVECNPTENLMTNKENLLEEILRERACELAFENTRYFDMKRYKRVDLFEKTLHRLVIHRQVQNEKGNWTTSTNAWVNGDKTKAAKYSPEWYEPSHFTYERVPITQEPRIWWNGFDVKWYMFPFPQAEVIKGYLVQNPGW